MKRLTKVALVLDASGSMSLHVRNAVATFNKTLNDIKEKAVATGEDTRITVRFFGSKVGHHYDQNNVALDKVEDLSVIRWPNMGSTALLDAVGQTSEDIAENVKGTQVSYLVIVITDGYENNSKKYIGEKLKNLIRDNQATDNWTYAFNVPTESMKEDLARVYKIPEANIRVWEQTDKGFKHTEVATSAAIGNYFKSRSIGGQSVKNFYTDLSSLAPKIVKTELDDLKSKFEILPVAKECSIKQFVESKGFEFHTGMGYYQLTKPETIQPSKELLIMEKGKKAIWGGEEARNLIGLPTSTNCKVQPGNHANYEIFVQSTSVNRKLVRGTKLLLRQ